MKKITYLLAICFAINSCSVTNKEETNAELFARIDVEIKENSKAYSTLKEVTETIGHRLTGSGNGAKAEAYVFNKFKEYGFENVKYQDFEVEAWSRGEVSLDIDVMLLLKRSLMPFF